MVGRAQAWFECVNFLDEVGMFCSCFLLGPLWPCIVPADECILESDCLSKTFAAQDSFQVHCFGLIKKRKKFASRNETSKPYVEAARPSRIQHNQTSPSEAQDWQSARMNAQDQAEGSISQAVLKRSSGSFDSYSAGSQGTTLHSCSGLSSRTAELEDTGGLSSSETGDNCSRGVYDDSLLTTLFNDQDNGVWLRPELNINPHDILFCSAPHGKLHQIGKGASGKVYKGMWMDQMVAIKVCSNGHSSEHTMRQFQKEVSILHAFQHKNIVQFKGACCWKGGKRRVLVTEYMEKGDLYTVMNNSPSSCGWYGFGRGYALDIAEGLAFLHANNTVHFDLKPANVLLDKSNTAKLADVGLAKTLTRCRGTDNLTTFMATSDFGTFVWAAPEVLLGYACDAKADIFSFGVVLHELCTGEQPYRCQLRPISVPFEAPQGIASLILQCLSQDPAARPSAQDIVDRIRGMP